MQSVVAELEPILKRKVETFTVPRKIGYMIPREALKKFLLSNAVQLDKENVVYNYLKTLSSSTTDMATRLILRFCWIVHKTPSELIQLGRENYKILEKLLNDFEESTISVYDNKSFNLAIYFKKSQCVNMAKCVKGFLKANDVPVGKKIFDRIFKMPTEKQRDYVPTKEEIKRFWGHANERFKLIIQFLTNCPLRREELLSLTWKDLDLETEYPILTLNSQRLKGRGKGKYEGAVFSMVICENLREELKKRKESEQKRFNTLYEDELGRLMSKGYSKEEAKERIKHLEWKETLPVFLSSDNIYNQEKDVFEINPLSYKTLGNLFDELQRNTGIPISAHSFRYYVESVVTRELGQDNPMIDLALGHKPTGIRSKYQKVWKDRNKMLEYFKKLEPYLDLQYTEQKKEELAKLKFREVIARGKSPEEAFEEAIKTYQQYLLSDLNAMKEILRTEVKKASEEYTRRYEK